MAGSTPPGSDELVTCERCNGFYVVEPSEDGHPRVRCNACGHTKDDLAATTEMPAGAWTVIGPDGRAATFRSWEELASSGPAAVAKPATGDAGPRSSSRPPDAKPASASEMLDVTSTPTRPRLLIAEEFDSDPTLVASKPKTEAAEPKTEAAEPKTEAAEPHADDDHETIPLSTRDIVPESTPEPLSSRDILPESTPEPLSSRHIVSAEEDDESEPPAPVSLSDTTVVPSTEADSTPPPPARGKLQTLPPTGSAAPPPTIEVSDGSTKEGGTAKTGSSTRAAERASDASGAPKRPWLVPVVLMGTALLGWRLLSPSPAPAPAPEPVSEKATGATGAPAETASFSTEPSEETRESDPAASDAGSMPASTAAEASTPPAMTAAPKKVVATGITPPPATAAPPPAAPRTAARSDGDEATRAADAPTKPPPAAGGTSLSDLLDQAASARRNGDYATARALYERVLRQNPRHVEANGGLGDVARAQGDLTAAKTSYERALAGSPAYMPAQLGLADTEWDLGNRATARTMYMRVVERLGKRAPERARQRSSVDD